MHQSMRRFGFDIRRWPPVVNPDRFLGRPDLDEHADMIDAVRPYIMTSPERIAALVDAVQYVEAAGVPGAIVECGVWRGGSVMAVALTLQGLGARRDLWLYDTFEGMTPPSSVDIDYKGNAMVDVMARQPRVEHSIWAIAPIDGVRDAMQSTGYPDELVHYVQGPVEETLPTQLPGGIALLRLDTDWYESTRHELEHLYPSVAAGGVVIIDDYGHHQGCRKAVDEYFADTPVLLHRIDYCGRMFVKR